MEFTLHVWRQKGPDAKGAFEIHKVTEVNEDISFLEMLDVLNDKLIEGDKEPIHFEHDCREGICGTCSMIINGEAHGPRKLTTACQLHMREFTDGQDIYVEPFRAKAFTIMKDLAVDRSPLDRVIESGGYVSVNTGAAPDGNAIPIQKDNADMAFDAAACIGCGACVAACPNGSGMLFTAAKVAHLSRLPQGQTERNKRVVKMVQTHDDMNFGGCTNHGECQEACPKGISISNITRLNQDYLKASLVSKKEERGDIRAQ